MNQCVKFCVESVELNLSAIDVECEAGDAEPQTEILNSMGILILVGLAGQRPGRLIIDMSLETARKLAEKMNDEPVDDVEYIFDTIAEFGNMVSGHLITKLNNDAQGLGLMLTPPSVFAGSPLQAVSPKIHAYMSQVSAEIGTLIVSVGFEGGF